MKLTVALALILHFSTLCVSSQANAQSVDDACNRGTWIVCGGAVKDALNKGPKDPKEVVRLATLWQGAYNKRYESLRKAGRLEHSAPDAQLVFDEVRSHLDPIEIAKDKGVDSLVKLYLPCVASVLEYAAAPLAAIKAFFTSSSIASDYDELQLANSPIQTKIALLLEPYLQADWKQKLNKAATDARPALIKP